MKNFITTFLIFIVIFSCSKDNDVPVVTSDARMKNSVITDIYASGKVSEQSAAEAKKTIFGKWNVGGSKTSTSKNITDCIFNYIEFTDSSYIMSLSISSDSGSPESGSIFGNYNLVEEGDLVTEVELFFSVSGEDIKIASLTNIEVIETASRFDATFDINFIIDFDEINIICNDLSGNYSADKEAAMDETIGASADSNHFKVTRNWRLSSYSDSEGYDLTSALTDYCQQEDYNPDTGEYDLIVLIPGCTIPSTFQVNLSTFGTYVTMTLDSSNSPLEIQTGTWEWVNAEQTQFKVDNNWIGTISSLSTTNWQFDSVEDEGLTASYSFTAVP